jgi:hypothetical protein
MNKLGFIISRRKRASLYTVEELLYLLHEKASIGLCYSVKAILRKEDRKRWVSISLFGNFILSLEIDGEDYTPVCDPTPQGMDTALRDIFETYL